MRLDRRRQFSIWKHSIVYYVSRLCRSSRLHDMPHASPLAAPAPTHAQSFNVQRYHPTDWYTRPNDSVSPQRPGPSSPTSADFLDVRLSPQRPKCWQHQCDPSVPASLQRYKHNDDQPSTPGTLSPLTACPVVQRQYRPHRLVHSNNSVSSQRPGPSSFIVLALTFSMSGYLHLQRPATPTPVTRMLVIHPELVRSLQH